jgi:anti-anti-sigma regulatory factor
MEIHRLESTTDDVMTVTGTVAREDVPVLRDALLAGVENTSTDLLVDTRIVTVFDEAALAAFVTARSRARFLRRRIVVLDADHGAVSVALRSSGLLARIPVHPDADSARSVLADRRASRARLHLIHGQATGPVPEPDAEAPDVRGHRESIAVPASIG